MGGKPLTPDERQRIADAIKAGKSRAEVILESGRSAGTVSLIAREIDGGAMTAFDASLPKVANDARSARLKKRRAEISELLLEDAAWLREMGRGVLVLKMGDYRDLQVAIGIALDKHAMLERYDSEDATKLGAAVDRWLDQWR